MNSEQIFKYIHEPELLQKAVAEDLERALTEYPYSSILQVLYLKALKNQNNYLYPKQLKRAALAVPNRKVLHDWVESDAEEKVLAEESKSPISFHVETKAVAPEMQAVEVSVPLVPVAKAPEIQPIIHEPVPVPPIPIPLPNTTQPVKEDDLDLMNIPASVRDTVLRARKIRQQFGDEADKIPKQEEVQKPANKAVPPIVETPIEQVPEFMPPAEIPAQPIATPVNEVPPPVVPLETVIPSLSAPVAKVPEVQSVNPELAPVPPIPLPEPVKPVKEDDLDLMNLPASVRETVQRARKIRQQFGSEEAKKAEQEALQKPAIAPKPATVETPVEKTPDFNPAVEIPVAPIETPVFEQTQELPSAVVEPERVATEEEVAADNFVLREEEAIEENVPVAETLQTKEKHSFLDWLETGMLEDNDEAEEIFEVIEEEIETIEKSEQPIEKEAVLETEPIAQTPIPTEEAPVPTEVPSTERVQELYQSFIEKPRLNFRAPSPDDAIDLAGLDTSGKSDYITETLAQVYVGQKLYNRAINAYEILRLKYPEKSSFFATRISEIKEFLNDKK